MSPSSSSFKKKLRRKKPGLVHRVKRVVSAHEHSYVKTALSQSRISNMSYKKRIQKLLENNKSLAQALEAADVTRQQQEQVILNLQEQLTLTNPTVIKRNIKKMGILIQQVVNLMADTLEHVIHIDDEDEEDVTDAQLPLLPATDVSNSFCSVPDGTPVKHSAAGPQRRSLHNDLREKFGICDLTVINEDTLRLQEMSLPPILFTDGEDNVNSSRYSKRNSSRHKSSRKGRSTISLSGRGSSVESSEASGRTHVKSGRCEEINSVHHHSASVSSQCDVSSTPPPKTGGSNESPSSGTSFLQPPKTPALSPLVYPRSNQITKSGIPRLVKDNFTARGEIFCRDSASVPTQHRETFIISSAVSQHDLAGVLKRSPNKLTTVSEAKPLNKSTVTGLSSCETDGAMKAQDSETTSHAEQTAFPIKEAAQQVPDIADDIQTNNCVLPQMEDVTVNLNEDMELTCPVGNFLAAPETHNGKTEESVDPSLVNEIEQQSCNSDENSDLTEIYSQAYCNMFSQTAKSVPQPKGGTVEIPFVSLVNEDSHSTKLGSQSQKEAEIPMVDLMNSGCDEASDVTEIYNVKAYYSTSSQVPSSLSYPKDQADKKLTAVLQRSPADNSGPQPKDTYLPFVSKSQTAVSYSCSPPKDHNVKTNSENCASVGAELNLYAHDSVTYVLKESDSKQLSEGFVTRTSKSKGTDMPLPKTVCSLSDSETSLQSTDRRGTFVVSRNFEEHCVESQHGPSDVCSLGKRKSRVKSSDTLNRLHNSKPGDELRSELKSPRESPSERNSPYRFPEKDCTSGSQEKTGKVSKSSKKSPGTSRSCTLGRKKLHLAQFSTVKSHNKKGRTDKEPKFKFFSKKGTGVLLNTAAKRKTDKLNQKDAVKQMDMCDVTASGSGDDQDVEKSLNIPAGNEAFALKRNDSSCSQECTKSVHHVSDVSNKAKSAEFSKLPKRKSANKESVKSKKAKFENQNQSKKEDRVINPTNGVSHEKVQLYHQPNLRSYHKRKSVSFRIPSDDDIHLFNHNESICLSSEIDHKMVQAEEVKEHKTQTENICKAPAVVEPQTDSIISEHKQCRESFVVLEDIFSRVSSAHDSEKQNDITQYGSGIRNCVSLQPSNTTRSPVKNSPSRSKSLKRDKKNERSLSDANIIFKKQIDCASSDPLSEEGKLKESSKPDTAHKVTIEIHESNKAPQSSKKVKTPHQPRKSTRKVGSVPGNKEDILKAKSISDELPKSPAFSQMQKSAKGDSRELEVICGSTENMTLSVDDKEARTTKNFDGKGHNKDEGNVIGTNPASEKQTVCKLSEPSHDKKKWSSNTDFSHEGMVDAHMTNKARSNSKKAKVPHQSRKSSRKGGDHVPTESRKENIPSPSRSFEISGASTEVIEGLISERESSGRSRRKTGAVSYKEPSLGAKLRRGDVYFPNRN